MATADYTFWLGREAEQRGPVTFFVTAPGAMCETVELVRREIAKAARAGKRNRL